MTAQCRLKSRSRAVCLSTADARTKKISATCFCNFRNDCAIMSRPMGEKENRNIVLVPAHDKTPAPLEFNTLHSSLDSAWLCKPDCRRFCLYPVSSTPTFYDYIVFSDHGTSDIVNGESRKGTSSLSISEHDLLGINCYIEISDEAGVGS